jgi:hypothetical protein
LSEALAKDGNRIEKATSKTRMKFCNRKKNIFITQSPPDLYVFIFSGHCSVMDLSLLLTEH